MFITQDEVREQTLKAIVNERMWFAGVDERRAMICVHRLGVGEIQNATRNEYGPHTLRVIGGERIRHADVAC